MGPCLPPEPGPELTPPSRTTPAPLRRRKRLRKRALGPPKRLQELLASAHPISYLLCITDNICVFLQLPVLARTNFSDLPETHQVNRLFSRIRITPAAACQVSPCVRFREGRMAPH